jgi:DNA-binding transcriptional MerR regulator
MTEYNIDEASRLSGITVRSLRNYVHQYQEFLKLARGPYNALVFSEEDLTVLVKIKSLLRDGRSRHDIAAILRNEAVEPAMTVTRGALATADPPVLLPLLKKIDDVLTELLEENRQLRTRLERVEVGLTNHAGNLPARVAAASVPTVARVGAVDLPVPYFLLALKDGCWALASSFWRVFISSGRPGR